MKRFDKLDNDIITLLRIGGFISPNATLIAKRLGKPVATIHSRLRRLESRGIVSGYAPQIDYKKIGEQISSFVLLQIPVGGDLEEFAEGLKKFEEIVEINYVVGEWAFICKVRAKDMEDYTNIIAKITKKMAPMRVEDIISPKTYKVAV